MALMTYLIRDHHGTYYFRRVIPDALRTFMPEPWVEKTAWKVTLATKDPAMILNALAFAPWPQAAVLVETGCPRRIPPRRNSSVRSSGASGLAK